MDWRGSGEEEMVVEERGDETAALIRWQINGYGGNGVR
jgi:hypothetical protein